jgi:hypothetical protein
MSVHHAASCILVAGSIPTCAFSIKHPSKAGRLGWPEAKRYDELMNGIIRLAIPGDCARIAAIYAPHVLDTAISFETESPSEQEMLQRVRNTLEFLPWLVCTHGDQVVTPLP